MTPQLTAYMLPHRHTTLSRALYGDEYGSGERFLKLEMISGQDSLNVKMPVVVDMRTMYQCYRHARKETLGLICVT